MISVKDAIESGAWYNCESDIVFLNVAYRIGILSFEKQQLSEKELKQYFDEGGSLWLMKIQVVSLNKQEQLSPSDMHESIYLQDQDGFQFRYFLSTEDSYIIIDGRWANILKRFSIMGTGLQPKTKVVGSIAFYLPDDDEAEYYIGVVDGTIAEV